MHIQNRFATDEECSRFERFLDWLVLRGRRESTTRSYRSDWQDLTIWYRRSMGMPFDGKGVNADAVAGWRNESELKGRSASTILRRLAFVRSYVMWLANEGVVDEVTIEAIRQEAKLKRPERGPRILPTEDVNRLLRQVESRGCLRDQAIIYTLLDSGVRISELIELDVGDIDFSRGELRVKSGRGRIVELPTRTARKIAWSLGERGLLRLPDEGEIVLPASGGWPPAELVELPNLKQIPALQSVPMSPMPFGTNKPPAEWPLFAGERGRLSKMVSKEWSVSTRRSLGVDATPQL